MPIQTTVSDYLGKFCKNILLLDQDLRFAGIADYSGELHATAYRSGLVPLIDTEQTKKYAKQTVFRARTRGEFRPYVGACEYAVAIYEKLIRATVVIEHTREERRNIYLMVSLDCASDYAGIIREKVIPYISKEKLALFENTNAMSDRFQE